MLFPSEDHDSTSQGSLLLSGHGVVRGLYLVGLLCWAKQLTGIASKANAWARPAQAIVPCRRCLRTVGCRNRRDAQHYQELVARLAAEFHLRQRQYVRCCSGQWLHDFQSSCFPEFRSLPRCRPHYLGNQQGALPRLSQFGQPKPRREWETPFLPSIHKQPGKVPPGDTKVGISCCSPRLRIRSLTCRVAVCPKNLFVRNYS